MELSDIVLTMPGQAEPTPIIRGISLQIHENETVAIVGPSGSGKTSLLMLMAGLERPSSGSITIGGEPVHSMGEDQLARFRAVNVGIVFQAFHLIPTMTALENVMVPLEFQGDRQARSKAEAALASLGLSHRLHHFPSQLSGGEQQRVSIARAFVPRPRILLADEPTGNLDQHTGQEVMDVLFNWQRENGSTLVLVTHDAKLAERCKRTIHIRDGRVENA